MLTIDHLKKYYDNFLALEIENLKIETGSIFGLVGVNGSGKSTLLRTISGVFFQEEGQILLDGEKIFNNEEIKRKILFIPDALLANNKVSIDSIFDLYSTFYEIHKEDYLKYLKIFDLPEKGILGKFSKGMARRVYLSIALASKAKVLLLDESFDGLDPLGKKIFKEELKKKKMEEDITVVISSHSLRELEDTCDSFCILKNGKASTFSSNIKSKLLKINLGYKEAFDFDKIQDERIKQRKCSSKIATFICEGDEKELEEFFNSFKPDIYDVSSLSLEEQFILINESEDK